MPGKKKKFIDKKNAVTFYLGHRSQKDPLIADENAPQHVLIPIDQVPSTSGGTAGRNNDSDKPDPKKRKEELVQFGIYFDDDYDYLQHLKDSNEASNMEWDIRERIPAPQLKPEEVTKDTKDIKIILPSSAFQSEFQEEVGLLNKAALTRGPRPDLDPDVVAALDDDFDFEDPDNELEDNFFELANCEGESSQKLKREDVEGLFSDEENDNDYSDMDEDEDSVGSLHGPQYTFADEETKSRFTNYSMSSSVIRRNKQLCLLDDRFERMYEGYEDTEIGALDCDEIEGHVNPDSDILLKYAAEFEEDQKEDANLNQKINLLALKEDESSQDELTESDDEDEKDKWDCESILTTYSTTKNRPKLIKEASKGKIKVDSKTGIPVGVFGKGLTKSLLKELDHEYEEQHGIAPTKSVYSEISAMRTKDETPEQRNERKKLLKEFRKERRMERKANTGAFKEEKKRQEKVRLNAKTNVQGLKL